MMGLISAVIFGLVAGIVAKILMPGNDPGGCVITSIIGIVGAAIGHYIGVLLHVANDARWSLPGFLLAVVGAIILLVIYRFAFKPKV